MSDLAGRIASWNRSGFGPGSATYSFDAAGNLTGKTREASATVYAYNAANQLTTETAGSVVTTHTYDEFGRITRTSAPSAETTYTWDALGHLGQISAPGMTATYEYGPSGMREYKSVTSQDGTSTTRSVWSGMQLLAELDSDGTRYEYVFGTSAPLELVVTTAGGTTTRYGYHTDAGGSVIAMTDQSGALVARYAYDPYGVPTAVEGGDIATRNPLRYRGYYYDAETGLYYLPARYYEPRSARFLSVDPAPPKAGDPVSLNRYSYCFGDPVGLIDPDGRDILLGNYYSTGRDNYEPDIPQHDAARNGQGFAPRRVSGRSGATSPRGTSSSGQRERQAADAALAAGRAGGAVQSVGRPTGFSAIVNVNGPSGMREMGQNYASFPTATVALAGHGAACLVGGIALIGAGITLVGGSAASVVLTFGADTPVAIAGGAAGWAAILAGAHFLVIGVGSGIAAEKAAETELGINIFTIPGIG